MGYSDQSTGVFHPALWNRPHRPKGWIVPDRRSCALSPVRPELQCPSDEFEKQKDQGASKPPLETVQLVVIASFPPFDAFGQMSPHFIDVVADIDIRQQV